ncbi:hypothetical protein [Streptomyces venezuelae]
MASFSDDFNRANSSDLGAGWVEVSGDWSIISNQLSPGVDTGTVILRAAGAMDSADHYAQVTIATPAVASLGVWCRGNSNISTGYLFRNDGASWDLFSVVSSTFTVIGTYAVAAAPGDVAKVQAVGNVIKAFVNGVERISVVNTAVTSGTAVGLRSGTVSGIRYDAFTAADLTAGATLGVSSSVEAAQSLTGTKTAALPPAVAPETAQPVTGAKISTLDPATASEAAQALAGTKTSTLGTVGAIEAAQPLGGSKSATLGTAIETATAHSLIGSKTAALVPAQSVEQARALTGSGPVEPGADIDITVGAPHSPWSIGAAHDGGWEVGAPC